jgi:hypothetical protein
MTLQTNETILMNWAVIPTGSPYDAPELRGIKLVGEVYNHPNFGPGSTVTTSRVLEVDGRRVRTRSRWYNLGDVCGEYVDWCEENGVDPPTWEEPIRMKL